MCKINPRVDFAFKKLFGSEENKDLLISLINAIVSEKDQVADVVLKNPYNLADYQAGKMSILDIEAKDLTGRWYNIEMQVNEDLNFDKRAIYYWAKLVTEQLSEGRMFRVLKKTISINILELYFTPDDKFHNVYKIINTRTGIDDKLHDIFELHYIELRKFRKDYHALVAPLDRWVTFLTRARELSKTTLPPSLAQDEKIIKAIEAVDRMFDEEERQIYEVRMETLADEENKIDAVREKALQDGIELGIALGIAESKAEGKREIAINLLDVLDDATIAKTTGLSIEEVKEIRSGKNR